MRSSHYSGFHRCAPRDHRIRLTFLIVLVVMSAAGCVHGRSGREAAQPSITDMVIFSYSLDPASRVEDFILLKVKVKNPGQDRVDGVIACLADHGRQNSALEHPFEVEPGKNTRFTIPFDRSKSFSYSVRCRLRYNSEETSAVRHPSPWVTVEVPAPDKPRRGAVSFLHADGQTTIQTRER